MAKLTPRQLARAAGRELNRLGWPGAVGIGLFAFCGAAYMSAVLPAQSGLEQAHRRALALETKSRSGKKAEPDTPAAQLIAFYKFFPEGHSEPDWLEKIFQAAQDQGLKVDQGEYRTTGKKEAGKLVRYQVTLPLQGPYPQIRQFLAAVLSDIPIASLDSVDFTRQKIADGTVEAKVRISLYLK